MECLAATPDGRHLFVATGQPRNGGTYSKGAVYAYAWDLGSLKLMVKPKIGPEDAPEAPMRLAVNATGDRIMAVRSQLDNSLWHGDTELFDANSGRMIASWEPKDANGDESLDKCFFSNDGRYMLYSLRAYSQTDERPTVNVVSATTGSSIRTIQLDISDSNTRVVTADIIEGTIYILDDQGRVFMQALSDNSSSHVYHLNLPQDKKADEYVWASVSPDRRSLFGLFKSKDNTWYVGRWRLADGRIEHVWSRGHDQGHEIEEVLQWDANFNAAGQLALVGSEESEKPLIVLEAGSDPDQLTEKKLPGGNQL